MSNRKTTLLVVSSAEPRVRLSSLLREEGCLLTEATCLEECATLVAASNLGLLVLGADLPGLNGQAIAQLRADGVGCPIIVLASQEAIAGWSGDVMGRPDDYVVEPFSDAEFVGRVRVQLQRTGRSVRSMRLGGGVVDLDRCVVAKSGGDVKLTPLERDLLAYFFAHPNRAIERDELLRNVWQYRGGVVSRAVDHTMKRLRIKVEKDPKNPVHLVTAHGVGYRFEPGRQDLTGPTIPARLQNEMDVPEGTILANLGESDLPVQVGRYTLRTVLGSGGMGRVFGATLHGPAGFEKFVALKVFRNTGDANSNLHQHMVTEARLGGLLKHPNIVDVYDFGSCNGQFYIAMERINGPTVGQLIKTRGTLPAPVLLEIANQLCAALSHAHGLRREGETVGLVHRDVKPDNILLSRDGMVKLMDFGVAKAWPTPNAKTGRLLGTPSYMSPQQAVGEPIDHRSDQFSLATVLVYLAVGRNIFRGPNLMATLARVWEVEETLNSTNILREVDAIVPGLSVVLDRCFQRDPEQRYPDMSAIRMALRGLRMGSPLREGLGVWLADDHTFSEEEEFPGQFAQPPPGPSTASRRRSNLPAEMDRFVGRQGDLDALEEAVASSRLVTVQGPGGMGKTRLCIHFARGYSQTQNPAGGVWFCDLSEAKEGQHIYQAVAPVLAMKAEGILDADAWVSQCGSALEALGPLLMVLDNAEPIVHEVAEVIGAWMKQAPEARFLISSRVRLEARGEQCMVIGPLSEEAAVDLFCERAHSKDIANERAVLVRIVDGLDRMPLAIELAAGLTRMFGPAQLEERLADRFRILRSRSGDRPERHASLGNLVDWSWDCLAPWEQDCLAQCAVFKGGFYLDQAEEVLDVSGYPDAPWEVFAVEGLIGKSLLHTYEVPGFPGRLRVGMYETIREYCHGKLGADRERLEAGHVLAYVQFVHRWLYPDTGEAVVASSATELAVELENIVAALERSLAQRDAENAYALFLGAHAIYSNRGAISALIVLGERLDALDGLSESLRAVLHARLGKAYASAGQTDKALEWMTSAARSARSSGLPSIQIPCEYLMAVERLTMGDFEDAEEHFDQLLGLIEETPEGLDALWAISSLATLCEHIGILSYSARFLSRVEAALGALNSGSPYDAILARFRSAGQRNREGLMLSNIAEPYLVRGETDLALKHLERAKAIFEEDGHQYNLALVMGNMGSVLLHLGQEEQAREYLTESHRASTRSGWRLLEASFLPELAVLATKDGHLDRAGEFLDTAEAFFRTARNQVGLVRVLCRRGSLQVVMGQRDAAEKSLAEAREIVTKFNSSPESTIGQMVDELEAQLA